MFAGPAVSVALVVSAEPVFQVVSATACNTPVNDSLCASLQDYSLGFSSLIHASLQLLNHALVLRVPILRLLLYTVQKPTRLGHLSHDGRKLLVVHYAVPTQH